jgi:class 3 adenylate cyclase/tetratricopeptide (TPR) repeat protein
MRCPACSCKNPSDSRFCLECGTPLDLRCPQCHAEIPSGAKFCNQCGVHVAGSGPGFGERAPRAYTPRHLAEKILTTRSALAGERRQVTVLYADMAGFTGFAERLDPEDVHRIIARAFEHVTGAIHRFEGTVNQYTGDGLMALFGAPIAHEDGPRRAVHAALAIQRALRDYGAQLEAEHGSSLPMRIGINTGTVVVGRIGDDLRMEYTAVGDTVNLAARLQQVAPPGGVAVTEATHKLVSGFFETRDLGALQVKGHTAPVHAFEVVRARVRRTRLDAAGERGLTPLVGRQGELASLEELFYKAKSGYGQVAFVVGDAGIGKSRLVLELRRRLAQAGERPLWLEGRCVSFGEAIPFLPVLDQLRESFGIEENDGEPEIIAKVEDGMRSLGGLEEQIPYVRYLLGVDPGDPSVRAMDAEPRRKRTFDAVRQTGLRGASRRPIVFVIEDLHWVDRSTEEYVGSVMDSIATTPQLLILTHRFGYAHPFGTRSFHTMVTLRTLSEGETLAMAGRVLGTEQFPAELKAALVEKAEGVPLFVEEVTKTLLDLGVLRREDGGYRMAKGIAEVSIPDTIQGIIMARLDRLGENGKRTVQLASVIGRQFVHRLLARVADLPGQLEGLINELKQLEIIYEQGLLTEPGYVFKHAVIQDVAYQSLLRERRKELHRAVAHAIEELYAERLAEHYGELAHHFFHAEEWQRALEYSAIAGERAGDAFANAEARKHYARAVDASERVGAALPAATAADVRAKYAAVLSVLGEYTSAVDEYERALELARLAVDRQREIDILVGLGTAHAFAHRPEPALQHIDEALAVARDVGDLGSQAFCHGRRLLVQAGGWGRLVETEEGLEQALHLLPEIADPKRRAETLIWPATVLQWRADFARAEGYLREAVELAEREHAGHAFGQAAWHLGHAKTATGDYEEALGWYRRLGDYAFAAGDALLMARAQNPVGGVHLELFDADEAIRLCHEGDEIAQKVFPWPEPRGHALLKIGLAHLQRGAHGLAEDFFGRAWALLELDVWFRWRWHIPLLRARGELALAEGRREEAWDFAVQSLEMATSTGSRKHVARAQQLQGEILAAGARLDEAARTLEASVKLAESLGTPREIWMGRAALGKVLGRFGREREAEAQLASAAETIEAIASRLTTPRLRRSLLTAEPVIDVFRSLGRRSPAGPT